MGMDYKYAGSASYSRFDNELEEIAKLFGGRLTDELMNAKENFYKNYCDKDGNPIDLNYFFGYSFDIANKYAFPEKTDPVIVKWFNNPYSEHFTVDDTKTILEEINKYHDEVEKISSQILHELEQCVRYEEAWWIT